MRFNNICDKMNVSGCDEIYNATGIKYILYNHQIELAFLFALIFIGLMIYFGIKEVVKEKTNEI